MRSSCADLDPAPARAETAPITRMGQSGGLQKLYPALPRARAWQPPTGEQPEQVQFLGPGEDTVFSCYVHELYEGQRMRPEKLAAWRALRERYGNRDESRVEQGALVAPAA